LPNFVSISGEGDSPVPNYNARCVNNQTVLYLECRKDEVIIDVTSRPGLYACNKYLTDRIAQEVVNQCLFKSACKVGASDLHFDSNCSIESMCSTGITYSCRPSKTVMKAFEGVEEIVEGMASSVFVKATEIIATLHEDMKEAFFNGSIALLEEHAKSLDASISTLTVSFKQSQCPSFSLT
jgi:hypothetical protein